MMDELLTDDELVSAIVDLAFQYEKARGLIRDLDGQLARKRLALTDRMAKLRRTEGK